MNHALTKKQKELVLRIYRFRFIDRIQLQKMLNHKDESRINKWLLSLLTAGYIGRIYHKEHGENRNPSIYYLQKKGIEFIRTTYGFNNPYLTKLRNEKQPFFSLQHHAIKAADFAILLTAFAKTRKATLEYYTKADFTQKHFFPDIRPDAYFILATERGKRSCFVEIDLETESIATMKKHMAHYITLFKSRNWKEKQFPIIATVCLTQKRLEDLVFAVEQLMKNVDYPPMYWKYTTFPHIQIQGVNADIWQLVFGSSHTRLL